MKRFVVNLTADERCSLESLVKESRVAAQKRVRAQILLRADEQLTDEEIADDLGTVVSTVQRVRERCCEHGLVVCVEGKSGDWRSRNKKFDGEKEARLVQIACSAPPDGRARWTLSLLCDKLVELEVFESIGMTTVYDALKKTKSNLGK